MIMQLLHDVRTRNASPFARALRRIASTWKGRSWAARCDEFMQTLGGSETTRAYHFANMEAVLGAVRGRGPDDDKEMPGAGVHSVANLPSVYVPAFIGASRRGDPKPYLNAYDLPKPVGERRKRVDDALPISHESAPKDIYYCAVDLNGCGIRFFGDVSLVLRETAAETVVLDRNSYDLERSPLREKILSARDVVAARKQQAQALAGRWGSDLGHMIAIKVLGTARTRDRRLTTGMISEALLNDEDYIEVLRYGSFGAGDLLEARVLASDVAADALVGDRTRRGPTPSLAAEVWRDRRRVAETMLADAGVRTCVVTTPGRVRV